MRINNLKQEGFLLSVIAILVLVILAGIGIYYLGIKNTKTTKTQTTAQDIADPTANWKTFTDPKSTYSIKYPANLYIKVGDKYNPNWIQFTKVQLPEGPFDPGILGYAISVDVFPTENKPLLSFIDERLRTNDGYIQTEIVVDGVKGIKILNGGFDAPTDSILFIKNDQLYSVNIKYFDQNKDKQLEQEGRQLFEQMLASFKFID